MERTYIRALALTATLLSTAVSGQIKTTAVSSQAYGGRLGEVHFPVSCSEAAAQSARQGLALLHHMTYDGARSAFTEAAQADPDCALAYWGQAMSYIHPLWSDPPDEAEFERGRELVEKAAEQGGTEPWEQAYIQAVQSYFSPGRSDSEGPNLAGFQQGWRQVHEQFPDDPEAAAFAALALLGIADPVDKGYERQKRAAQIVRPVLEAVPQHPGAHHYTIHAYDYPPLAAEALAVARSYGQIAPSVPHALHMPSHIFVRLGLWEDAIVMNRRSAEAALAHPADGQVSLHYPHALDYLAYAHLQRGEMQAAEAVAEKLGALKEPLQPHVASAYALAAVPARLALERQQWDQAAALAPRTPEDYPWDRFPAMEAITHFARALGAARSGEEAAARQALEKMEDLQSRTEAGYWSNQVEIQRLAAEAWLSYQQGKQEQALKTLTEAARQEAATEKHPVTPGEVLPAHELLADMLLEMERYSEAQQAYQQVLARSPGRLNSLYGLARAAELAGDTGKARRYYGQLLVGVAEDAEGQQLDHARQYLKQHGPG